MSTSSFSDDICECFKNVGNNIRQNTYTPRTHYVNQCVINVPTRLSAVSIFDLLWSVVIGVRKAIHVVCAGLSANYYNIRTQIDVL
jgi:hypothetical protein